MNWPIFLEITAEAFGGLSLLLVSFLAGLGRYHVRRLDTVIEQISHVREKYVTRDELLATLTRSERVIEDRHEQNIERLDRIEGKIEENAKDAKQERSELRAAMQATAISVATLTGKATAAAEIAEAINKALKVVP